MTNTKTLAKAAALSSENNAASNLLLDLHNAETAEEVLAALDKYDSSVTEN